MLKVPKLMDYLRLRSARPGFGKLPIVAVVVMIDANDPRPDLLAGALESGVDAVLRRPLERSVVTACLGEVLRRHANIELVYKVRVLTKTKGLIRVRSHQRISDPTRLSVYGVACFQNLSSTNLALSLIWNVEVVVRYLLLDFCLIENEWSLAGMASCLEMFHDDELRIIATRKHCSVAQHV